MASDKTAIARRKLLDGKKLTAEDKAALEEGWRRNSQVSKIIIGLVVTIVTSGIGAITAKVVGLF